MPNWNQVLDEIQETQKSHNIDAVRRQYLAQLSNYTGRNTIAYYSSWLSTPQNSSALSINDEDKNGFMATIHGLDRSKGLDLILHTPGGDIAAAESLVNYLHTMFGTNIRAIIPQLAMSAGTMISCACEKIIMGKESNLGPIDPQLSGFPANGVISEFNQAIEEVTNNPASLPIWQTIIGKYHPTFLGNCQQAIVWSEEFVKKWLTNGMFKGNPDAEEIVSRIIEGLSDRDKTYNHSRHIHVDELRDMGLEITSLEDDDELQDLVLTIHHVFMHSFSISPAHKIIENQNGIAFVRMGSQS